MQHLWLELFEVSTDVILSTSPNCQTAWSSAYRWILVTGSDFTSIRNVQNGTEVHELSEKFPSRTSKLWWDKASWVDLELPAETKLIKAPLGCLRRFSFERAIMLFVLKMGGTPADLFAISFVKVSWTVSHSCFTADAEFDWPHSHGGCSAAVTVSHRAGFSEIVPTGCSWFHTTRVIHDDVGRLAWVRAIHWSPAYSLM